MIGVRIKPKLKDFLQKLADKERRSLNNFIVNAVLTYAKDHHGVNWDENEKKAKD